MIIVTQPVRIAGADASVPLTHARILYRNLASTATATDWQSGHAPETVLSPNTYEFWRPTSATGTLAVSLPDVAEVDCVCIGAHTLGSSASVLIVETAMSPLGPWDELAQIAPGSDVPIMLLFGKRNIQSVRIRITSGAAAPAIGVVSVGIALAMQRMIYGGVTPITMARATDIRPNYSETGQFLGRRIVAEGIDWRASWSNLAPWWYREKFEPFARAARTLPFFIAWRPEKYPAEVAYGWTTGDITPSNMGTSKGYMSVGLSMRGVAAWEPGMQIAQTVVVVNGVTVIVNGNVVILG